MLRIFCAFSICVFSNAADDVLTLLQVNAVTKRQNFEPVSKMARLANDSSSSSEASFSEAGYLSVAAQKNNTAMRVYIEKVLVHENLGLENASQLAGFVPYYSGQRATGSYVALVQELRRKFATDVTTKLLHGEFSELPTKEMEALKSNSQVNELMQAIESHEGLHGGSISAAIRVSTGGAASGFIVFVSTPHSDPLATPGSAPEVTGSFSEQGYLREATLNSTEEMKDYMRRVADFENLGPLNKSKLSGVAPFFSGEKFVQNYSVLVQELKSIVIDSEFADTGYHRVAAEENETAMKYYMMRVAEHEGLGPLNKSKTSGVVPYFSGTRAVQNYSALVDQLREIALRNGSAAPLTEAGYREISAWRSDEQMKLYCQRLAQELGLGALNKSKLGGIAQRTQSLESLKAELRGNMTTSSSTGHIHGSTEALSEKGYQNVASLRDNREMSDFIQRVAMHNGHTHFNISTHAGFAAFYSGRKSTQSFDALVKELAEMSDSSFVFNEAGYQEVASMKSNERMKEYIIAAADHEHVGALNKSKLSGLVPFHSGERYQSSYVTMLKDLRSKIAI